MANDELRPDFEKRRRTRLIVFLVCEAIAICVLVLAGGMALSHRLLDPSVNLSLNVITIAAAAAVAIIPILFFAASPVIPRGD